MDAVRLAGWLAGWLAGGREREELRSKYRRLFFSFFFSFSLLGPAKTDPGIHGGRWNTAVVDYCRFGRFGGCQTP